MSKPDSDDNISKEVAEFRSRFPDALSDSDLLHLLLTKARQADIEATDRAYWKQVTRAIVIEIGESCDRHDMDKTPLWEFLDDHLWPDFFGDRDIDADASGAESIWRYHLRNRKQKPDEF